MQPKAMVAQAQAHAGTDTPRFSITASMQFEAFGRNGKFIARITVEDDAGRKSVKWVPLEANTTAEPQEEFRTLLVESTEDKLRHIGRCRKLSSKASKARQSK